MLYNDRVRSVSLDASFATTNPKTPWYASPAGTGVEEEEGPAPYALLRVAYLAEEEQVEVAEAHHVLPPDIKVLDHLSPRHVEPFPLLRPVLRALVGVIRVAEPSRGE